MQDPDDEVAPDGSPVAIYLAVPTEPGFTPVLGFVPPGATVLDLGCGVGRLANVLARRGHRVTGVDESAQMLRHLDPAVRAVASSIQDLRLDENHDVVVLASHLVNTADRSLRRAFVAAAASHVAPGGHVLIEHYPLDAGPLPDHRVGRIGEVQVVSRVLGRDGSRFDGETTYRLGERSWVQRYTAEQLDAEALDTVLGEVGLRTSERLSPTWTVATHA